MQDGVLLRDLMLTSTYSQTEIIMNVHEELLPEVIAAKKAIGGGGDNSTILVVCPNGKASSLN